MSDFWTLLTEMSDLVNELGGYLEWDILPDGGISIVLTGVRLDGSVLVSEST